MSCRNLNEADGFEPESEEEAKPAEGFVIDEEPETETEDFVLEATTKRGPLLFAAAADSVQEDNSFCGVDARWKIADGTLTISGSGEIEDYSTSSLPGWYDRRDEIRKVIVEKGITGIGELAFYECSELEEVSLSETVKTLKQAAFYGCYKLSSVTIPAAVDTLPSGLFYGCSSLETVNAPGVVHIEDYAFQGMALQTIRLWKNTTDVADYAFFGVSPTAYEVEAGNTNYSSRDGVLFTDGGSSLKSYPNGKTDTSYVIPAGVKKIMAGAFARNGNLQAVTIPEGVTEIGDSAFQECYGLKSLRLPDSLTEVGYFAFHRCGSLEDVRFGSGLKSTSYEMFSECNSLQNIDFGTGLEMIYNRTFASCGGLKTVVLPANVHDMESGAFVDCGALETFTCHGLTAIPYGGFGDDKALTRVNLNEGLEKIYREAFGGCDALAEVELPMTVTYVDANAFPETMRLITKKDELSKYGKNGLRVIETISVSGTRKYDLAYQQLKLTNAERAKEGLPALVMNYSLLETAMTRAAELSLLFSHTRPDGSSCMDANDLMAGENIAGGNDTAQSVTESWMNSPDHRDNILTKNFTTVGIGCVVVNGTTYWVQCSGTGSDSADCRQPANQAVTAEVAVAAGEFNEAPTTSGVIWGTPETYQLSMTVNAESETLYPEETAALTAYLTGTRYVPFPLIGGSVTFRSSDSETVAIKDGKAVGKKPGIVTITAETKNGRFTGEVRLTVIKKPQPETETSAPEKATEKSIKEDDKIAGTEASKTGKETEEAKPETEKKDGESEKEVKTAREETVKKTKQKTNKITAKNLTFTQSARKQTGKLNASSKGGTKLTYKSNNKKVKVSSKGKITVAKNFCGKATITITAKASKKWKAAKKTVTVTVKPAAVKKPAAKALKKGKVKITWKAVKNASGYEIQYSTKKSMKGAKTVTVKGASRLAKTISGLKAGKKVYYRVRAYKKVGSKKIRSAWSKKQAVKVK